MATQLRTEPLQFDLARLEQARESFLRAEQWLPGMPEARPGARVFSNT